MRFFIFLFFIFPISVSAQSFPEYQSTYVNDFAQIIDAETESRIVDMLKKARADRDLEMTVVTIDTRHQYGNFSAIEPFATGLFNHWGVGDADRNDGIMVLVAVDDRDMRIELGSGYAPIFDDRAKNVIDHYFLPYFRQDKYAEGIEAGVAETIKRIRLVGEGGNISFGNKIWLYIENFLYFITSGGIVTWITGLVAALAGGGIFRRFWRNRPRKCGLCNREMVRLTEESEDDYLSRGQQVEESVKSKDYDVWLCRHDDHVLIEGYRNWFTRHKVCNNCDFRTLHSQRTVLEHATTSSTGRARVDYDCKQCDHSYSETVTIPRKTSSSSGSSGSFGGGSSSGGGASGSW